MIKATGKLIATGLLLFVVVPPGASANEPIKIAAIFPKTGDTIFNLEEDPHFRAVGFAVEELNRKGGLLGRPLVVSEYDNQSSGIGSKKAAERAVQDGVIAVIGSGWSSHSLAIAPVLQAAKIIMISPDSTHPDVTRNRDYVFRVGFIDSFQGALLANFATNSLHAKTAIVLTNIHETYCIELSKHFIESFSKNGGEIVWQADYDKEPSDIGLLVENLTATHADIILLPGTDRDSSLIIKKSREMGLSTTFLGGDAWGDRMYSYAGTTIEGSYFSSHWHKDKNDPKSRDFVKAFSSKHGVIPEAEAALTYDAVMLLADAVKRAGSLDGPLIQGALAATANYEGVTGVISMDEHGDPMKPGVILQYREETSVYIDSVTP